MRQLRTTGPLVLLCLVALSGASAAIAGDGASDPAALARRLCSPVAAERASAVRAAVEQRGKARTWARSWVASEDPQLRAGGWSVLADVGVSADLHAARAALADPQPQVARRAAEALIRLAERLPLDGGPSLPRDCLSEQAARALTYVLATRLDETPTGTVPAWYFRLGEGVVPCLVHLLQHPRFDTAPRRTAIAALAATGGDASRRGLSALVDTLEAAAADGQDVAGMWEAWWRAVVEVGPGKGLEGAHDLVVRFAKSARGRRPGQRPPGLRSRTQAWFFRFVASCPPAAGIEHVRAYIDEQLERAAEGARWRLVPSMAPAVVLAHLVIAEPNDERLEWDALAARAPRHSAWRRRQEELGQVLVHLEPYRARAGLQSGLTLLLDNQRLPKTVRAWALYLQGETEHAVLRTQAEALIDADGAAATLAQRRLGAELLDRVGPASPERIRAMLTDFDAWMRAMGLRWATAGAAAGTFPIGERDAALRKARQDKDRGLFLLACELAGAQLSGAERGRLLEIALAGPRTLRARAWKAVARALPTTASPGEDPFSAPHGHAALDERLRAAALAQRLWAEDRR